MNKSLSLKNLNNQVFLIIQNYIYIIVLIIHKE